MEFQTDLHFICGRRLFSFCCLYLEISTAQLIQVNSRHQYTFLVCLSTPHLMRVLCQQSVCLFFPEAKAQKCHQIHQLTLSSTTSLSLSKCLSLVSAPISLLSTKCSQYFSFLFCNPYFVNSIVVR